MINRTATLATFLLFWSASAAIAQLIDFSSLAGADVSDADGQNFGWTFGAQNGTVNVRATWPDVVAIDGAMRTPVRGPASFASPFTGTVTFTFDQPVEVEFLATFPSLTRDGLSGGRFEQVRLSSPGAVQFAPLGGTTAIYTGIGTNSITADDEFSPTPTLSLWGMTGAGTSAVYELQYTGTTVGLSETFTVTVVPEPLTLSLCAWGLGLVCLARRRLCRRLCRR